MACRICLEEGGDLISPCACKGTTGYVHSECLEKWTPRKRFTLYKVTQKEINKNSGVIA